MTTEPLRMELFAMKVRTASHVLGSKSTMAQWVGDSRSQITRWSEGRAEPPAEVARAVTDLEFIIARAHLVWDDAALRDWLEGQNAFLDGATPLEMVRRGRTSEVLEAITGAETGVFA